MKIILLPIVIFCLNIHAAISPHYKEVVQRSYDLIGGDSVRFPDGSTCKIDDFNNGVCGQKWMTSDYCVSEGGQVWDADRCCEGLIPYLEEGSDGQEVCREESFLSYFSSKTILYFFIGVLIPLSLFVILAISIKRRLPKNE